MAEDRDNIEELQANGPAGPLAVSVIRAAAGAGSQPQVPFLFLHPTNLSGRCWLPVARLLPTRQRILLDSRGHGRSHMNGPFGVADYAADACAVMDALHLEKVHLVGGSIGGSVACAVAAAKPERVVSIVAVGAALEPADASSIELLDQGLKGDSGESLLMTFLKREVAHGLPFDAAADACWQIGFERRGPELIREITLNAFSEDASHYAARVSCPVFVLTGEFDDSCPPEAGRRMVAALGARARFELLPGAAHLPMLQMPLVVAAKISQFIEQVPNL